MEELISELLRMEVDHTNHLFNGCASSEAYTKYLTELFGKSNTSNLDNSVYANSIRIKLQDLDMLLNIHLPSTEDVEGIKRDYLTNPLLKQDVEWYTTLYNIRGIKEYYRDKIIELLQTDIISSNEIKISEQTPIEDAREWITYKELIRDYHFKGVTRVKDAEWRKKHNFYPCKQDGKRCALRINVTLLKKWLNGEKE